MKIFKKFTNLAIMATAISNLFITSVQADALDDCRNILLSGTFTLKYENITPPTREAMHEKKVMISGKGLIDEVKGLLNKYQLSNTAKAAIGYKEVIEYLEGKYSLEECKELIKKRTRNYAKRQVTFFKHQLPCKEYASKEELLKEFIHG